MKGEISKDDASSTTEPADRELQKQIDSLTESLKEMEIEKNNAEYTLSRRQDEFITLTNSMQTLKNDFEAKEKEFAVLTDENRQLKVDLTSLQDHATNTFLSLSDLVTSDVSKYEEKKSQLLDAAATLFEKSESDVKESNMSTIRTLLDQVQIIKQSAASAQETVKKHQELTEKQESYIKQMEASLENNKSQIESLEHRLASVNASHSDDDESYQLEELEEANASLRTALRNAKERMEAQLKKQQETETQLMQTQEQLVAVQENSNEMVQQALAAAKKQKEECDDQMGAMTTQLDKKEEEVETLKASWEKAVGQYEQELAVLRSRKMAVEQQMSVSEKFLHEQNVAHRDELTKLQASLEAAEAEAQELRCQLLEKEAECESNQQAGEETTEQLKGQIASLTEQLRAMQTKLSSQQSSVVVSKKRELELESEMREKLAASIQEMEEKDKEIIRQQQKGYEEEVSEEAGSEA